MNTNSPATVNTKAATAVIAAFLLFAVLFGTPAGTATADPGTGVSARQIHGK